MGAMTLELYGDNIQTINDLNKQI